MKQLFPSAGPAQLRSYLVSHALDAGPPGADSQFGAGRAQLQLSLSTPHSVGAAVDHRVAGRVTRLTALPGHVDGRRRPRVLVPLAELRPRGVAL